MRHLTPFVLALVGFLSAGVLWRDAVAMLPAESKKRPLRTTAKRACSSNFIAGRTEPRRPYFWLATATATACAAALLAIFSVVVITDGLVIANETAVQLVLTTASFSLTVFAAVLHFGSASYRKRVLSNARLTVSSEDSAQRRFATSRDQLELRNFAEVRNGSREDHNMSDVPTDPPQVSKESEEDQLTPKDERLRIIEKTLHAWRPHSFDVKGNESIQSIVEKWRRKRAEEKASSAQ